MKPATDVYWLLFGILVGFVLAGSLFWGYAPLKFVAWLNHWQTLAAALVASVAAYIAFRNTTRTLKQAERLEANRRSRKLAALRAVLPLALSQIADYAERSARAINNLVGRCREGSLPPNTAPIELAQPLPSETLEALAEFIEYSDTLDVRVLETTIAWIQVHDARVRTLAKHNWDASSTYVIPKYQVEAYVIDAASIYAGAVSGFDYARGRDDKLPTTISWDAVLSAFRNMQIGDDKHPELYREVHRRQGHSTGPFERFNTPAGPPASGTNSEHFSDQP